MSMGGVAFLPFLLTLLFATFCFEYCHSLRPQRGQFDVHRFEDGLGFFATGKTLPKKLFFRLLKGVEVAQAPDDAKVKAAESFKFAALKFIERNRDRLRLKYVFWPNRVTAVYDWTFLGAWPDEEFDALQRQRKFGRVANSQTQMEHMSNWRWWTLNRLDASHPVFDVEPLLVHDVEVPFVGHHAGLGMNRLPPYGPSGKSSYEDENPIDRDGLIKGVIPVWRVLVGAACIGLAGLIIDKRGDRRWGWWSGSALAGIGLLVLMGGWR